MRDSSSEHSTRELASRGCSRRAATCARRSVALNRRTACGHFAERRPTGSGCHAQKTWGKIPTTRRQSNRAGHRLGAAPPWSPGDTIAPGRLKCRRRLVKYMSAGPSLLRTDPALLLEGAGEEFVPLFASSARALLV